MKTMLLFLAMVVTFVLLIPLSWWISGSVFNHPFENRPSDPVLLVCLDHIEVLHWSDTNGTRDKSLHPECTFQVNASKQAWVENEVRGLPSPAPGKSRWTVQIRQLGPEDQQVDLELVGDGTTGLIYEAKSGGVTPLKTRYAEQAGALVAISINACLWAVFWFATWWAKAHTISV